MMHAEREMREKFNHEMDQNEKGRKLRFFGKWEVEALIFFIKEGEEIL